MIKIIQWIAKAFITFLYFMLMILAYVLGVSKSPTATKYLNEDSFMKIVWH